jgi:hypothetical protein
MPKFCGHSFSPLDSIKCLSGISRAYVVYQACPESMIKEYISHKFQYYLICIYLASVHKLLSIIYLQISYHLSTNYSLVQLLVLFCVCQAAVVKLFLPTPPILNMPPQFTVLRIRTMQGISSRLLTSSQDLIQLADL